MNSLDFKLWDRIIENISGVIAEKDRVIEMLLVALIAGEHALIEDVPELGKTLMVKSLAKIIGGEFKRVQFTPNLLPSESQFHWINFYFFKSLTGSRPGAEILRRSSSDPSCR